MKVEKTYEQLLEENEILKAKLKLFEKSPRTKFVFPESLGKKYFSPNYKNYDTSAKLQGAFIQWNDINSLSLVIRTVLFATKRQVGKTGKGRTVAKRVEELTDQEYETYLSCMDDFMGALKRRIVSHDGEQYVKSE